MSAASSHDFNEIVYACKKHIIDTTLASELAVLALVGRKAMRTAPTAERTREMLKEDARWAKQQIAR